MSVPAKRKAAYADLYDIPKNMTGEIIGGELHAMPRPSRKHAFAATVLGGELSPPYQLGKNDGPGGWIILIEPEVSFGEDILVPDLAGWKRERFPMTEDHNWISMAPDWICEILSPATAKIDKTGKMPIYAQHDVPYLWLIDPISKTLDVFQLENRRWVVDRLFAGNDKVRAQPFPELEFDLDSLWMEGKQKAQS